MADVTNTDDCTVVAGVYCAHCRECLRNESVEPGGTFSQENHGSRDDCRAYLTDSLASLEARVVRGRELLAQLDA